MEREGLSSVLDKEFPECGSQLFPDIDRYGLTCTILTQLNRLLERLKTVLEIGSQTTRELLKVVLRQYPVGYRAIEGTLICLFHQQAHDDLRQGPGDFRIDITGVFRDTGQVRVDELEGVF